MKEIKNIRYEYDFEKSIVIQKAESTMCAIKHRDSGELKEMLGHILTNVSCCLTANEA